MGGDLAGAESCPLLPPIARWNWANKKRAIQASVHAKVILLVQTRRSFTSKVYKFFLTQYGGRRRFFWPWSILFWQIPSETGGSGGNSQQGQKTRHKALVALRALAKHQINTGVRGLGETRNLSVMNRHGFAVAQNEPWRHLWSPFLQTKTSQNTTYTYAWIFEDPKNKSTLTEVSSSPDAPIYALPEAVFNLYSQYSVVPNTIPYPRLCRFSSVAILSLLMVNAYENTIRDIVAKHPDRVVRETPCKFWQEKKGLAYLYTANSI